MSIWICLHLSIYTRCIYIYLLIWLYVYTVSLKSWRSNIRGKQTVQLLWPWSMTFVSIIVIGRCSSHLLWENVCTTCDASLQWCKNRDLHVTWISFHETLSNLWRSLRVVQNLRTFPPCSPLRVPVATKRNILRCKKQLRLLWHCRVSKRWKKSLLRSVSFYLMPGSV